VKEIENWFDASNIYANIWRREQQEGYQEIPH
jgi:hypothetical protein